MSEIKFLLQPPSNKCCYTTWRTAKQILNVCLRNSIPYSIHTYPKFICRSYRRTITSKMSINEIHHMINGRYIWEIRRLRKKLYVFCWQEILNISCNMKIDNCWKIAPRMPWRKGTTSDTITSLMYLLLFIFTYNSYSSYDRSVCAIAAQTITLGNHPLRCSITH